MSRHGVIYGLHKTKISYILSWTFANLSNFRNLKVKRFSHLQNILSAGFFFCMYFTTLKDNILYPQLCGRRSLTDVILDFVLYNLYIRKMFCLSLHNPNTSQSVKKYYNFDLPCHSVWLGYRYPKNGKCTQNQPGENLKKFPFWAGDLFGHPLLKKNSERLILVFKCNVLHEKISSDQRENYIL